MEVNHNENNCPSIVCSIKVQSETISSTNMYNMKSDRQARHAEKVLGENFNRHRYTVLH